MRNIRFIMGMIIVAFLAASILKAAAAGMFGALQ